MPWGVRDHMDLHTITEVMLHTHMFAVGAKLSPEDQSELKFLYESDEDFSALPGFGVIPSQVCWYVGSI